MPALNDERIITPEAVVLELHAAGPGSRIFARLIDLAIQAVLAFMFLMGLAATMLDEASTRTAIALFSVMAFVVMFVVPIALETAWRGRSVGKLAMGIRVVTMDGGPISFRHAVVRGVLAVIDIYLPFGLLPLVFTRRYRRFGDLVAGTFVLSERSIAAKITPTVFLPVPGLERYVAELDVSRMTDDQYVFVRATLLRLREVADAYRAHLCAVVSSHLEQAIGVARPEWLAPEPFLVCVAGAYQLRSGTLDRAEVLATAEWQERAQQRYVPPSGWPAQPQGGWPQGGWPQGGWPQPVAAPTGGAGAWPGATPATGSR